jgi:hypothetical protein
VRSLASIIAVLDVRFTTWFNVTNTANIISIFALQAVTLVNYYQINIAINGLTDHELIY